MGHVWEEKALGGGQRGSMETSGSPWQLQAFLSIRSWACQHWAVAVAGMPHLLPLTTRWCLGERHPGSLNWRVLSLTRGVRGHSRHSAHERSWLPTLLWPPSSCCVHICAGRALTPLPVCKTQLLLSSQSCLIPWSPPSPASGSDPKVEHVEDQTDTQTLWRGR